MRIDRQRIDGQRVDRSRVRHTRLACVAIASLAFGGVAAGCGDSNDASDALDNGVVNDTVGVASLPPVQPTAATSASTTSAPAPAATTATTATTSTSPTSTAPPVVTTTVARSTTTQAPVTTAAAAAPCDITRIVTETGTAYEEITPEDLRCAGVWASWIGRPADQFADGFFAVAYWTGASWELANLGTAGICADAGVPTDLWDRLGCFE